MPDARGPIEISARVRASGGPYIPPKSRWGSLTGYTELIILVHGYNRGELPIRDVYADTYGRLRDVLPLTMFENVATFYWPGDASRFWAPSAAAYFAKIGVAEACGRDLADRLTETPPDGKKLTVWLIGHSLGCRLVLETVRHLRDSDRVQVAGVLLMAAAVPEGLCEGERRYADRVAPAEVVLHSEADHILKRWFTTGQLLARIARNEPDPGPHKGPVGLSGQPGRPRWDGMRDSVGLDHNQYWSSSNAISQMAALVGNARWREPASHQPDSRRPPEQWPATRLAV